MESDDKEPKPKMSLELDQEKPPKKKGVWQRILEVLEEEARKGREEGESRDPSDW